MYPEEIKVQLAIRKLFLVTLILTMGWAYADEQLVAQYTINSLNTSNQALLIVENIKNFNVTRVSISYYGNSFYMANEIRNAINQSYNQIPVEMNSLNSYMTYSTAQAIVNLYADHQSDNQQSNQSTGNFFNYDSEPKGFFNYGGQ